MYVIYIYNKSRDLGWYNKHTPTQMCPLTLSRSHVLIYRPSGEHDSLPRYERAWVSLSNSIQYPHANHTCAHTHDFSGCLERIHLHRQACHITTCSQSQTKQTPTKRHVRPCWQVGLSLHSRRAGISVVCPPGWALKAHFFIVACTRPP